MIKNSKELKSAPRPDGAGKAQCSALLPRSIIFILICLFLVVAGVTEAAEKADRVLILNSYHPGFEWTGLLLQGIESGLKDYKGKIDYSVEYMDTKRFNDKQHYENFYTLLKNKARRQKFDTIITVDNNALLFLLKHREELYPDVPVVFCGVDIYHASMYEWLPKPTSIEAILNGNTGITGVLEVLYYDRIIETALTLHPSTKKVILVNDGVTDNVYWPAVSMQDFAEIIAKCEGQVKFSTFLLTRNNTEKLLAEIQGIKKENVVLLLADNFLDSNGDVHFAEPYWEKFWKKCDVPTYVSERELFGIGHIVGGNINSGYRQGQIAGRIALQILNGKDPAGIPIVRAGTTSFMFDYDQMRHFGIRKSKLPEGSIIINQPQSFYYQYWKIIWAVAATIASLALVVVILSVNILRRKQAEEKLYLKNIALESAINAIAFGDLQGNLIYVNKAFLKLWGYSDENEVLGKLVESFWLSTDKAARVRKVSLEKGGWFGELVARKKDGSTFDVQLSASLVNNESGEPLCITASFIDVSGRKHAEQALRESEQLYRMLVENINLGITLIDAEHRITMINLGQSRLFNKPAGEFVGKYCFREFEKRDAVCSHCPGTRAMVSRQPETVETEGVRDDGSRFVVRIYAFPIFETDGAAKGFIEVVEDLTESKRAEEALRQSEQKYRALSHNIPGMVYMANPDWSTEVVSESEAICGYSADQFNSKKLNWLDIIHHDDKQRVVQEALKLQKVHTEIVQEYRVVDKNGDVHWVEDHKTSRFAPEGFFEGVDGVVFDITERKRAQKALQQARDDLETRVEQRTADLAKAIEDLKKEITERKKAGRKLLTYQKQLQSLASELSLAEERLRRRVATNVHDNIGQNLAISKMKLESLRQSASSKELAEALDDLSELIAQTIESSRNLTFELSPPVLYDLGFEAAVEWLVRQTRQRHTISAEFESDRKPKPLQQNVKVLLFQAVRELLVNVAKYARAKNVHVSAKRLADEVQVIIEDDGVGFDTSQLRSVGSKMGGFGLFSIRERLTLIGGRVDILSKPAEGTRIILAVPIDNENKKAREKKK